jgi:hypothetical protein
MEFGAVLPDDNRAGKHLFSIEPFNAESLAGTITAVNRATAALFMSHLKSPRLVFVGTWDDNVVDSKPGILLAMTGFLSEMVFMLEFEDNQLFSFDQTFRSGQYFGTLDSRCADGNVFIIPNEQDLVQFYLVSLSFIHQVDIDHFARNDLILFSTGFYNRVNGAPPLTQQLSILAEIP